MIIYKLSSNISSFNHRLRSIILYLQKNDDIPENLYFVFYYSESELTIFVFDILDEPGEVIEMVARTKEGHKRIRSFFKRIGNKMPNKYRCRLELQKYHDYSNSHYITVDEEFKTFSFSGVLLSKEQLQIIQDIFDIIKG